MWKVVKSFEKKENIFPSNLYLFHEGTYICEIKDTSLFNNEILNNAVIINQFMDDLDYVTTE